MASTVLVVTALEDVTADWVIAALNERGASVARVDPADIGPDLVFGARIGAGSQAWAGRLVTGKAPVLKDGVATSLVHYTDPLPQALVLTAIVIAFAMTAVSIVLAMRSRSDNHSDHVDAHEPELPAADAAKAEGGA